MTGPVFDDAFRRQLAELFRWRRDVREFRAVLPSPALLDELLAAACLAPSVGLSQPWRFVIVEDPARRAAVRRNFETANAAALQAYEGEKAQLYGRLKLAGLDQAPWHVAVFADHEAGQGHGLGRRTMPETTEYSVVGAIQTLWLAARAAGIGVGWVSILEPAPLARDLDVPDGWIFVAYLCLGYPAAESETPALETAGWDARRPPAAFILRR